MGIGLSAHGVNLNRLPGIFLLLIICNMMNRLQSNLFLLRVGEAVLWLPWR
jgi:hypothetical protein